MHNIDQFLARYGDFAVFGLLMLGIVGPLIPDETILVLAGIAVHRGQMHAVPTLIAAFAGSVCGITLSYALGRTGGVYALNRIPFLASRLGSHLPEAHRWFDRYGKWTLFFGYFLAGVRHFTALVAGTSGLDYLPFAAHAYPGGFIWVVCFLAIGYYLGEGWQEVAHRLDSAALILAAAVVLACAIWYFLRRRNSRRAQ